MLYKSKMKSIYSAVAFFIIYNRFAAASEINKSDSPINNVKPITVLEYKPITSFFHPAPFTTGQLVPEGTPWPASPEGYETTLKPVLENMFETEVNKTSSARPTTIKPFPESSTVVEVISSVNSVKPQSDIVGENKVKPTTVLEYRPSKPPYLAQTSTIAQLIPSGTPWPDSSNNYTTQKPILEDKFGEKPSNENSIVLGYKPTRPSFLPEPSTIGQLIPPGKPWPDSPSGFNTTLKPSSSPTLENKFGTGETKPATVLEYKPTRPSFLPEPSTVGPLVPPGKPWPASVNLPPQITDRISEINPTKPTTFKPPTSRSTHIILTYRPQRPWYLPEPTYIGQIIPPGTPWPASAEGYVDFSATKRPRN